MAIKKITLPDNTTQDIQDSRIPGVDSTPTSGSSNLVTSGGVYTSLSSKATDSSVVHKTGAETIGGNKTFTGTTQVEDVHNDTISGFGWITDCDSESIQDVLDGKANDSGVVHKTTAETISGNKTFTGDNVFEKTEGPTIIIQGNSANKNAGSIIFRGRSSSHSGIKIEAAYIANALSDRQGFSIYASDSDAVTEINWERALYINRRGEVFVGASSNNKDLTVFGDLTVGTTGATNTLTMNGDIVLPDGGYIQSAAGSNMCGMSASKEFLIGAGFEETDGFIISTGDHGITHRRYEDATTYHDWNVWDGGNLNRNDCNFTVKDLYIANHLHLPNNKLIYMKDSSGTEKREMYLSASNNLIIGIDQNGLGNTYLYGNNIAFRPTNTSTTVATISPTGVTVDSGDLTVASPSNVAFSSTSNTLADIIPNITASSSEPTSSQGSDGDIWIVV